MAKYRLKKNNLFYNGRTYWPRDVLEVSEFPPTLPRGWFEEVIENSDSVVEDETVEKLKTKRTTRR